MNSQKIATVSATAKILAKMRSNRLSGRLGIILAVPEPVSRADTPNSALLIAYVHQPRASRVLKLTVIYCPAGVPMNKAARYSRGTTRIGHGWCGSMALPFHRLRL